MSFIKIRTLHAKIKLSRTRARREYIKLHGGYILPRRLEVHHVDFCPLNNEPDNLLCITRNEHNDLHAEDGNNEKSHAALHAYLDLGLKDGLDNLTSLLTIYNTELTNGG